MKTIILLLSALYLAGCANTQEVKAPCDYYGTFCGTKMKINP